MLFLDRTPPSANSTELFVALRRLRNAFQFKE